MPDLSNSNLVISGININNENYFHSILGSYGFKGAAKKINDVSAVIESKYLGLTSMRAELKSMIGELIIDGFDVDLSK